MPKAIVARRRTVTNLVSTRQIRRGTAVMANVILDRAASGHPTERRMALAPASTWRRVLQELDAELAQVHREVAARLRSKKVCDELVARHPGRWSTFAVRACGQVSLALDAAGWAALLDSFEQAIGRAKGGAS
jgi:hypothetical protein